jgi:hypothetical protein
LAGFKKCVAECQDNTGRTRLWQFQVPVPDGVEAAAYNPVIAVTWGDGQPEVAVDGIADGTVVARDRFSIPDGAYKRG